MKLRQQCEDRLNALKTLRNDYDEEYLAIARMMQPSRSRFLTDKGDKDRGKRRRWNSKILDPKAIESFRTLGNGMTSGLTSASRPWFALTLKDKDLLNMPGVRDWLSDVEKRMYAFLAGGNFYGASKSGYHELGLFGFEACVMEEHRVKGLVFHPLTIGESWIGCGDANEPDVLARYCPMSAREVVQVFGTDTPDYARKLYDSSDYTKSVDIYQIIEPNSDFKPNTLGSMPWRSIYWCTNDEKDDVIRETGRFEQPFWGARWDVTSGETYGSSPGMDALPAVRELQMKNKRLNEVEDQISKPERVAPPNLRLTGQPGRIVSGTGFTKDNFIVPYVPDYQAYTAISTKIDALHQQIDMLSFADLFNAITNMQGIQPRTVEEIAARNEEKLTQLGPVIERVNNEKLSKVIERTYGIMLRGGLIPPVPEVLSEMKIEVEFNSILHQMQRMVGIGQIERTAGFVGNLMGVFPDAGDKIDVDEMVEEYAERAGAPSRIIRDAEEVQKVREARAQQQQMAQAAEMAPAVKAGADAAKVLSEVGQNNLSQPLPASLPV